MTLNLNVILALGALALCLACTPSPSKVAAPSDQSSTEFSALMIRNFQTAPDAVNDIILDRRTQIDAPALDGIWFYGQMNTGLDKKLYRQRVNHLRPSETGKAWILEAYVLKNPELYADAWNTPQRLQTLTAQDFKPVFGSGCEQIWTMDDSEKNTWNGYVNPKTCKIFSERRQTHIYVEAETRVTNNLYMTSERGFDENGQQLWGSKPSEMIILYPIAR